jgi:hypothetical protein
MMNILNLVYFLTIGAWIKIYFSRIKNTSDQYDAINILACAVATVHIVLILFSVLLAL